MIVTCFRIRERPNVKPERIVTFSTVRRTKEAVLTAAEKGREALGSSLERKELLFMDTAQGSLQSGKHARLGSKC